MQESINNLICISFIGTAYHGSQIQSNAVTVQEVFQNALKTVMGYLPDIKCCSRTDSGVHAKKFYISFFTQKEYESDVLVRALNMNLPRDIRVISHRSVPESFHARYSSKGKRYEYLIWNDTVMNPFLNERAFQCVKPMDITLVNEAAKRLVGTHDYSSFCSVKSSVDDKVRTVRDAGACCDGKLITMHFEADGFLYNMARIMAGALCQIANGKISPEEISEYLNGRPRDNKLITLPPYGLYLTEVYYDFGEQ